ncbi:Acetyltransferase (GNAT) domain-containing protein [Tenacibaculum sp. 190524A02b]|uniref:Acetyltransferase (GNAT) domain-containing protein n=1 Tax=Tenacibaculum vairaonense TaxID=3137860 RepID=A0ABP1FCY4_9FLAO
MITYTSTQTEKELLQIIELQKSNLPTHLTEEEKKTQGFVTVQHDLTILSRMHEVHPHIIAKENDTLAGYALSMSKSFREEIPILAPMFTEIDKSNRANDNYLVMGQVCVNKEHRGKGVFRGLYQKMKEIFSGKYNAIITEIDVLNTRSINAHSAIGFTELQRYELNGQIWVIVVMDI